MRPWKIRIRNGIGANVAKRAARDPRPGAAVSASGNDASVHGPPSPRSTWSRSLHAMDPDSHDGGMTQQKIGRKLRLNQSQFSSREQPIVRTRGLLGDLLAIAPLDARVILPGQQRTVKGGLSLRWQLVWLVVAGVIPLLVFSLGYQYLSFRREVTTTGQQTLALARSISLLIDEELQLRIAALRTLSSLHCAPAISMGCVSRRKRSWRNSSRAPASCCCGKTASNS